MSYHAQLARFYAAHGIAVFPVEIAKAASGKFDKRPLVRAWADAASVDPAQIDAWWRQWPNAAVGLPMGRLEAVALDGDTRPDCDGVGNLWKTLTEYGVALDKLFWSKTPSGGVHVFYRSPRNELGNSPKGMPPGVDVRGAGGFVVAPGSIRPDGAAWGCGTPLEALAPALRPDGALLPLPEALRARMLAGQAQPKPALQSSGPARSTPAGLARAQEHANRFVEEAAPGNTNNLFNNLCFHQLGALILGGDLSFSDAELIAMEAAAEHGDDMDKQRGTMESAFRAIREGRVSDYVPAPDVLFGLPYAPPSAQPARGYRKAPCGIGVEVDFGANVMDLRRPPLVEGVAYEGQTTLFAGRSFGGKTTFMFSLVAASIADVSNFVTPQTPLGAGITARPAAWVYVSGERDQGAVTHIKSWIESHGLTAKHPERFRLYTHTEAIIQAGVKSVVTNGAIMRDVAAMTKDIKKHNPGLPVVVVIDNLQTAVDDLMLGTYAAAFFKALADFHAEAGEVATVLITHPAKSKESVFQGSGAYMNRVDVLTSLGLKDETDFYGPRVLTFDKCRPDPGLMTKQIEIVAERPEKPRFEIPGDVWQDTTPEWRARNVLEATQGHFIRSLRVTDKPKPELKRVAKPAEPAAVEIPAFGPIAKPATFN